VTRAAALTTLCTLLVAAQASARVDIDLGERVRFERTVPQDSVTVGERFTVSWRFDYPDSLTLIVPAAIDAGECRLVSLRWREEKAPAGRAQRSAEATLIGLDLEQAFVPENAIDFRTPGGDTVRVFTGEVAVPVRSVAAQGDELSPLKSQWEAPRRVWPWIAGAAGLVALAIAAWIFWRRRRNRAVEAAPEVRLPADVVALAELSRIERMGLVEAGEIKRYYTLVTDAVRRYIDDRYGVDAMDLTTQELVAALAARRTSVDGLEVLLGEADLVKFARFAPTRAAADGALRAAREIVVRTTPREAPPGAEDAPRVAGAVGGES